MKTKKSLVLPLALAAVMSVPAWAQISTPSISANVSGAATGNTTGGGAASGLTAPGFAAQSNTNANVNANTNSTGVNTNSNVNSATGTNANGSTLDSGTSARVGTGEITPFRTLDTDANGAISRTEFDSAGNSAQGRSFQSVDTDGDGMLSQAELNVAGFVNGQQPNGTVSGNVRTSMSGGLHSLPSFRKIDADHNGSLTIQEFDNITGQNEERLFHSLDVNHDGVLNKVEWKSVGKTAVR